MEQWRRGRGRLGDVLLVGGVGVTGISGTYDNPSSPIVVYEIIQQIVHGGKEGCLLRWLDVHGAGRQRSQHWYYLGRRLSRGALLLGGGLT